MQMDRARRRNAVEILKQGQQQLRATTVRARMRYAVSLIVAGADGGFSLEEVERGMGNERVTALARQLLQEAGAL